MKEEKKLTSTTPCPLNSKRNLKKNQATHTPFPLNNNLKIIII
jgi:hypothetical protein